MPQQFLTPADLRSHGLTPADVRGDARRAHEAWRLPPIAVDLLKGVLASGFNLAEPIHVHELTDPPGFVFTQ